MNNHRSYSLRVHVTLMTFPRLWVQRSRSGSDRYM